MKPIYQTISNSINGNCVAAVIASLLEKEIDDVPNFVERNDWFTAIQEFMFSHGYKFERYIVNGNRTDLSEKGREDHEWFHGKELPDYGSINGFYDATVYSRNFPGCFHAVVCDKQFNIVHDPSTAGLTDEKYPLADEIGYNGVVGVTLWVKI